MRLCLLAFLCAMPANADPLFPVSVQDARPDPTVIAAQPETVVGLSNFAADMLVAVGIAPLAITTYEGKRPLYLGPLLETAADLGDLTAPNLELLAVLDPDLTVGLLHYNGPYEAEISAIGDFLAFDSADTALSKANVLELGTALGVPNEAARLNTEFEALQAEIVAQAPEEGPEFLFLWHYYDTFFAYQDNLMTAELVSSLGARNLVGFNQNVESAEQAFVLLDPEELLALDPEVLFVFASHGGPIKPHPVFDRLQAVRTGRAHSVGYQYSQPGGPIARSLVLREAAYLLYPERFEAPVMPEAAAATKLIFAE